MASAARVHVSERILRWGMLLAALISVVARQVAQKNWGPYSPHTLFNAISGTELVVDGRVALFSVAVLVVAVFTLGPVRREVPRILAEIAVLVVLTWVAVVSMALALAPETLFTGSI